MEEQALIPVAQTDISIAGFTITVVLLPDGQTGAVFAMFCQILDLQIEYQLHRVHNDPALFDSLVLVALETPGGPQPSNVMYDWAIPLWLASIRAGKRPPAYQERLRVLRREAFRGMAAVFRQASQTVSTVQAARPPVALPAPAPGPVATTVWDDGRRFIDRLEREHADLRGQVIVLQDDLHSQHLRLAALESGHARPTIGLSPQRLTNLVFLARQLRQRRGVPISDTLMALAAQFQVADAFDMPDSAWLAILTWFEEQFIKGQV